MENESNVQNPHITKWKILAKSGCLSKFVAYLLSCAALAFIAVQCFKAGLYSLVVIIGSFLAVFLACSCAYLAIKEAIVAAKILCGQYTIAVDTVLSSKFANPYGGGAASDRVLHIGKMRVAVGYAKSVALPVGSEAVVVHVKDVAYPVMIEDIKIFQ